MRQAGIRLKRSRLEREIKEAGQMIENLVLAIDAKRAGLSSLMRKCLHPRDKCLEPMGIIVCPDCGRATARALPR